MSLPLAQPPWSRLGKRLESMVRKALFEYKMLENANKLGVALSGGKDSLSLLFLLKAISGRGVIPFQLHAFHVAGAYTCGAGVSLSYLQGICDQLEVPFIVRESTQKLETLECYSCSRERRKLLFDAAKSLGVTTIAFGHHRDDNTQTILMNMLHKAEFCGLLPKIEMQEYGVTIIRPLIYNSEQEITTFAEQYGFRRIMCGCPVGQQSLRKKTDELLKEIEELYPNARANIAQAGLLYGSEKARR